MLNYFEALYSPRIINSQGCVFTFFLDHILFDLKRAIMRLVIERIFQERPQFISGISPSVYESGMWCNKFDTVFSFQFRFGEIGRNVWGGERQERRKMMKNYELDIELKRWKLHERPLRLLNFTIMRMASRKIFKLHDCQGGAESRGNLL